MPPLQDDIKNEIKGGRLPNPWTTADLRANKNLSTNYVRTFLDTDPPNRSMDCRGGGFGQGHNVNPQAPIYCRVGRRRALLFEVCRGTPTCPIRVAARGGLVFDTGQEAREPSGNEEGVDDSADVFEDDAIEATALGPGNIAEDFRNYLANKPYRTFKNTANGPQWGAETITGWNSRLQAYRWAGTDWTGTKCKIAEFSERLRKLKVAHTVSGAPAEAAAIYSDISAWGNPRARERSGSEVLGHLHELWLKGEITEVDSTLTKLYAFACPDRFVIYDSRVAAAILTTAEDLYRYRTVNGSRRSRRSTISVFQNQFKHLGNYMTGGGGTRPRGYREKWPRADGKIHAQYDANRLCCLIKEALNRHRQDDRADWTLREVESVLFMEGY